MNRFGWCSIAPRETYEALERYKALPRIDPEPVWSVVCFFVDRRYRGQHLTVGLLKAGLDYARSMGAGLSRVIPWTRGDSTPNGVTGDVPQRRLP